MADPTLLTSSDFTPSVQVYAQWLEQAVAMRQTPPPEQAEGTAPQVEPLLTIDVNNLDDVSKLWDLQRNLTGGAIEAVPADEPTQVASIANAIMQPYQIREGKVQLAGCVMEPQPFLRITTYEAHEDKLTHHWFDRDGGLLHDELPQRFGLQELVAVEPRLRETDGPTVSAWIDAVTRDTDRQQLVGATVVWFLKVNGKIRIHFDSGVHASLPFEGWAIDFAAGRFDSPRFVCPESGMESYNIVCLDNQTVTVAEAIAVCEMTGQEAFRHDLETCSVSGKTVLPNQLFDCPVSGERLLPDLGDTCSWCMRKVSPAAMVDDRCRECCQLRPLESDNSVVQSVREQRAECARIKHWKGWITEDCAVLVGSYWLREIMIVLSLADMRIIRTATRSRLSSKWQFDDQKS